MFMHSDLGYSLFELPGSTYILAIVLDIARLRGTKVDVLVAGVKSTSGPESPVCVLHREVCALDGLSEPPATLMFDMM